MNVLQPFEKFIAWVAGAISGRKAAQAVDNTATTVNNSPLGQTFNTLILTGASNALGTAKNITPAEQAVLQDVLQGVKPAADPYTYMGGLLSAISAIPSSEVNASVISLATLAVEAATATYIASHPAPASLLAPATQQVDTGASTKVKTSGVGTAVAGDALVMKKTDYTSVNTPNADTENKEDDAFTSDSGIGENSGDTVSPQIYNSEGTV